MLYTLADHNATVIALTDAIGRVVAQYGYTPYGDLLAAELFANGSDSLAIESLAAARGNRLGHQGLRTERFDRPWDGPMDIASAVTGGTGATGRYRSLCHNRNRLYDPAEGRFTGVDPNGLGVPVLDGLAFGGMAISAGDVAPDLTGHYGDGMNAHVAYAAMPRGVRDPSGLTAMGTLSQGLSIGSLAFELVGRYAENMLDDVEWATDWSMPDDAYSRLDNRWVGEIFAKHIASEMSFGTDLIEDWFSEDEAEGLDGGGQYALASGGTVRGIRTITRVATIGGRSFLRYGQLHHALPRYIARALRVDSEVLVRIPKQLHSKFHRALEAAFVKAGIPHPNKGALALKRWIKGDPTRARKVLDVLRRTTKKFGVDEKIDGLDGALKEAMGLAGI